MDGVRSSILLLHAEIKHLIRYSVNVIVYYSTIILGDTGISPELVTLLSGVMNTCFALGNRSNFTYLDILCV